MMQFNPMYINVSDNTANISLGNSPKLKNNKYLFADIIKVLMGNIESGSMETVNVNLSGEQIKVSEVKLIDIQKKEPTENSIITLFPTFSVLPDSLIEKIEKSFADLSTDQLVSSENEIKITAKEIKELLGQNLNFKSIKKQLLNGKELLVNIENETEQLNLNFIAEKTNKNTNYFANVSLIKNKPVVVDVVSGMFDSKPIEFDEENSTKIPVNVNNAEKIPVNIGEFTPKQDSANKNDIIIKTFVGDKVLNKQHKKTVHVKENPVKIITHSPNSVKAKVFEINKQSSINLFSQLKDNLSGKLNFDELNKIEIHKTLSNELLSQNDFTKLPKTEVDFKISTEKFEKTKQKQNFVTNKQIKKPVIRENDLNQTKSKESISGKELFEQEYFLVKDKTIKKQPKEIEFQHNKNYNKDIVRKADENDKVKLNQSKERFIEKDVKVNSEETSFVKDNKEKQVHKPQLKTKVTQIRQSVNVENEISPKDANNADQQQNEITFKNSNSKIKTIEQNAKLETGKVQESTKVRERDLIKSEEKHVQPEDKANYNEKSVQNKFNKVKQASLESESLVKAKESVVKNDTQIPEQAKLEILENIESDFKQDVQKVEIKKTKPTNKNETPKAELLRDEENEDLKTIEKQKEERKNIKHSVKKIEKQPAAKVEIKNEPIKVQHENKQAPIAKAEFETHDKKTKTVKENSDKAVNKVENNQNTVSGSEEKSESKDFSHSNNQKNNDLQIKDTVKHHNSKANFDQVLDKTDLHKSETAQTQQRSESVLKSVKYTELFKEVSRFIQKNEKSFMVLELEPKHLGKVNITLDSSSHSIKAHIQVDNLQAKQLLENNLDELFSNLNKNGIQLGSLDISLNDANRQQNENLKNNNKAGNFSLEDLDNEVNETSNMKYYGYNTYEYLA